MSLEASERVPLLDRVDLPGLVALVEVADADVASRAGLRALLDGAEAGAISRLIVRALDDVDQGRAEYAADALCGYLAEARDRLRGFDPEEAR